MKRLTVKDVTSHIEKIINAGRDVQVSISPHSTPGTVLSRMTEADLRKLDVLGSYHAISANDYDAKASLLWTSLFYKIGEQILIVGDYHSPFERFFAPLNVGVDVEEVAPRLKNPINRDTLPGSAVLSNYVTQYDSFYHRVNRRNVFATTYSQTDIARMSNTWDNLTNMLNAELANLEKSVAAHITAASKDAMSTSYLAGVMDVLTTPAIIDDESAKANAIAINNVIDRMQVEPTTSYIPFNHNTGNTTGPINDVATSPIWVIGDTELLNNVEFRTTLNTYFGGKYSTENNRFSLNLIPVAGFATSVSADVEITPGYTALTRPKPLKAVVLEENAMIFRMNQIGRYSFDNAATLNTNVFHHIDMLTNISDRRKVVAVV